MVASQAERKWGLVGTELKLLFQSIGIHPRYDCSCFALIARMNRIGVDGCRVEFEDLVLQLEDNAKRYNWKRRVSAANKALASGLAFRVNWLNPIPSFLDIAIERALSNPKSSR